MVVVGIAAMTRFVDCCCEGMVDCWIPTRKGALLDLFGRVTCRDKTMQERTMDFSFRSFRVRHDSDQTWILQIFWVDPGWTGSTYLTRNPIIKPSWSPDRFQNYAYNKAIKKLKPRAMESLCSSKNNWKTQNIPRTKLNVYFNG